jgi:hypothetical protein
MTTPMPRYYKYYNRTYKLDRLPNGNIAGFLLNLHTGAFEENNDHIFEVRFDNAPEIRSLDEARFIEETERERQRYLRGDGPIFALYDTIQAILDQVRAENRRISPEERALIVSLRRRTFQMWDEEFARRAAGEPPTFEFRSVVSG